jgi:CBS domain-containing protein
MKVSEIMTRDVCLASPKQSLRETAAEMAKHDVGVLPVGEKDRLVGMITDRDIAIRGISRGLGPDSPVREVMSAEVKYCFGRDRGTARATLGEGLSVSAFPLYVPV